MESEEQEQISMIGKSLLQLNLLLCGSYTTALIQILEPLNYIVLMDHNDGHDRCIACWMSFEAVASSGSDIINRAPGLKRSWHVDTLRFDHGGELTLFK